MHDDEDLHEWVRALEEKVRLLQIENAGLAEQAEDSMLLGLVAEAINQTGSAQEVLEKGLERISILKDICLCFCCSSAEGCTRVIASYVSFGDEDLAGMEIPFSFPPTAFQGEARLFSQKECEEAGLRFTFRSGECMPQSALLISVESRYAPVSLFIFVDNKEPDRLGRMSGLLQRVVEMMAAKIDNLALNESLRELNAGLDRKVEERSEELRKSEQFVRNILDSVDESFIVIGSDFRILTANRVFCEQAGLPCSEVIGQNCFDVGEGAGRPCRSIGEDCAVRKAFATGLPQGGTHRYIDRNGRLLYVETRTYPLKDESGNVTSVIETMNNITEKHLLEEERLKTQKLESIGTLAGGIAHDFNNLLQGIFGYISMAKISIDRKESLAFLEHAENALQQSVSLATQLLTFSKGGRPVKKRTLLRPVIETATKFALSGSRSTYRLEIDPGLWWVDADGGQLGQVIQNIVLNADQAMPAGGNVAISAENVPDGKKEHPQLGDGRYVRISIQDTGIGIPERYLEKIFDIYFTTKEKGSGLGLATSYSIVKNHGGLIDVTSQHGKGSTFAIYLPAVEAKEEPEAAPSVVRPVRKGKILVMDDEEVVRSVAEGLLGALGHEVATAEDGEGAVELYRTALESGRPFDVVILDLTVRGGMGGGETLERLRTLDPGVRAVVSSGYSEDAVLGEYEKYGFQARLTKPYTVNDLKNVLSRFLGS